MLLELNMKMVKIFHDVISLVPRLRLQFVMLHIWQGILNDQSTDYLKFINKPYIDQEELYDPKTAYS